ncbi:amino acid permease-domain-containing protein [Mycena vitilis]|nr:amino acid permease-domain-containing protein [Mycena vitilis]
MTTAGESSQTTNYGAVEDGVDAPAIPHVGLHRGLSARQVQMIAIAGTIGTGLFLGTGKSLAEGGPASMLICYGLVGFIVYVTLLLLGEMATQYPIAGSFNAYTARFFSPSYAFALSWNYWFNDAVSVASDLTAAQLVLQFWTPSQHTWVVSLVFWIFLVGVNATHTSRIVASSSLIILGMDACYVGVRREVEYGGHGTNVVRDLKELVPWDYPNLSNRSTTTSPFTLVFKEAGSTFAASFMNTVILTSVLSAGNHALFAGTRAPKLFAWTTPRGVPLPALLLTSSSFIASGELWGWLQNIVGVSNQIPWLSIGLASWRFRKAWIRQGKALSDLKFHTSWTWPYGPPFVVLQGWSSVLPVFSAVDFLSFYIEVPVMIVMYLAWASLNRPSPHPSAETPPSASSSLLPRGTTVTSAGTRWFADLVDFQTVDLNSDQYEEDDTGKMDEEQDRSGALQRLLYWLA